MRRLLVAGLLAIASTLSIAQPPASQTTSAQARLDAIVQQLTTRGGRGAGAGGALDPAALLAALRAIDSASLSPASALFAGQRVRSPLRRVDPRGSPARDSAPGRTHGRSVLHADAARAVPASV